MFPMPFKKLHAHIKETLERLEITTPTEFQIKSIPVIKSSANTFCVAPKGSGKTTTIVLTTLQKINCEEVGDAPRAIVLVENMVKAKEIYDVFLEHTRFSDMRTYMVEDKVHVDLQKSEIFEGVDILISTPKALNKLLKLYGVNMSQLKLFSIDDAEFLTKQDSFSTVMSITQSISKCQFVIYSEKTSPYMKRLESYFMEHSRTVSV